MTPSPEDWRDRLHNIAGGTLEPVEYLAAASIAEADGSHGEGPLAVVRVGLAPMQLQILTRRLAS